MPIKPNKILTTLQEEVTAHGIYHAHYFFPFIYTVEHCAIWEDAVEIIDI